MQPLPSSEAPLAQSPPASAQFTAGTAPHADGEAAPLVTSSSGAAAATSLDDTANGGAADANASLQASSSAASLPAAPTFAPGTAPSGYKLKVIFVGDQAVGKTSIISRFMYDAFERHYQATLGIDFLTKAVVVDGRSVRLQLWDTAGQERFRSLIPSYIRNSAAAIVVFDVTSRESFTNVARWVDDVRAERGDAITLLLVGNKSDLGEVRVVSAEEAAARAADLGAAYAEVSAKTGANVKALFRRVAASTPPPPEAMAAAASAAAGGVDGSAGYLGAGAGAGAGGMRRLDPLLVTPSRTQAALAARAAGSSAAGNATNADLQSMDYGEEDFQPAPRATGRGDTSPSRRVAFGDELGSPLAAPMTPPIGTVMPRSALRRPFGRGGGGGGASFGGGGGGVGNGPFGPAAAEPASGPPAFEEFGEAEDGNTADTHDDRTSASRPMLNTQAPAQQAATGVDANSNLFKRLSRFAEIPVEVSGFDRDPAYPAFDEVDDGHDPTPPRPGADGGFRRPTGSGASNGPAGFEPAAYGLAVNSPGRRATSSASTEDAGSSADRASVRRRNEAEATARPPAGGSAAPMYGRMWSGGGGGGGGTHTAFAAPEALGTPTEASASNVTSAVTGSLSDFPQYLRGATGAPAATSLFGALRSTATAAQAPQHSRSAVDGRPAPASVNVADPAASLGVRLSVVRRSASRGRSADRSATASDAPVWSGPVRKHGAGGASHARHVYVTGGAVVVLLPDASTVTRAVDVDAIVDVATAADGVGVVVAERNRPDLTVSFDSSEARAAFLSALASVRGGEADGELAPPPPPPPPPPPRPPPPAAIMRSPVAGLGLVRDTPTFSPKPRPSDAASGGGGMRPDEAYAQSQMEMLRAALQSMQGGGGPAQPANRAFNEEASDGPIGRDSGFRSSAVLGDGAGGASLSAQQLPHQPTPLGGLPYGPNPATFETLPRQQQQQQFQDEQHNFHQQQRQQFVPAAPVPAPPVAPQPPTIIGIDPAVHAAVTVELAALKPQLQGLQAELARRAETEAAQRRKTLQELELTRAAVAQRDDRVAALERELAAVGEAQRRDAAAAQAARDEAAQLRQALDVLEGRSRTEIERLRTAYHALDRSLATNVEALHARHEREASTAMERAERAEARARAAEAENQQLVQQLQRMAALMPNSASLTGAASGGGYDQQRHLISTPSASPAVGGGGWVGNASGAEALPGSTAVDAGSLREALRRLAAPTARSLADASMADAAGVGSGTISGGVGRPAGMGDLAASAAASAAAAYFGSRAAPPVETAYSRTGSASDPLRSYVTGAGAARHFGATRDRSIL